MRKIGKLYEGRYLYLDDFHSFVDTTKIEFYEFIEQKNGTIKLCFYDKKGKVLKLRKLKSCFYDKKGKVLKLRKLKSCTQNKKQF